jgi:hypothetical protein
MVLTTKSMSSDGSSYGLAGGHLSHGLGLTHVAGEESGCPGPSRAQPGRTWK